MSDRVTSPTGSDANEMIPRHGYDYPTTAEVLRGGHRKGAGFDPWALSIPHDDAERAALYAEAGLTGEERQAMDQWCFDQQRKRARGVLLNDAENHR